MQDPAFGLRASRYVRQTTFHALGYAVFASASLRDALERLVRYSRLVSDDMVLRLETTERTARLSFELASEGTPRSQEAMDAVMSLIVRTCRGLTDRSFTLLKVEQHRPEPADITPYAKFFRCPVEFGAPIDALTCDAVVLDKPLPSANPELAAHNDVLARKYLAQIGKTTLLDRVRSALMERLSGDPSSAAIGAALGMSARSLQRQLKAYGTSCAEIRETMRRDLARAYLRRQDVVDHGNRVSPRFRGLERLRPSVPPLDRSVAFGVSDSIDAGNGSALVRQLTLSRAARRLALLVAPNR